MANLSGQNIGTNYKGILNLNTLNGNLSGTLQAVTDGDGNASPLTLSTGEVGISRTIALGAGSSNVRLINETYTINNSGAQTGTATGIFLNATETALNGMTHNLMDLQVGGVSQFRVSKTDSTIYATNYNISASVYLGNSIALSGSGGVKVGDSRIRSDADGNLTFLNDAANSFGLLKFGGTTNAFPAIKRNGAAIDFRVADDSAFCGINSSDITTRIVAGNTASGLILRPDGAAAANLQVSLESFNSGIGWTQSFLAQNGKDYGIMARGAIVGGSTLGASAVFQIDSTTKGFLPPRMTEAQRDLISAPAAGLMVYNTTTNLMNFFNGTIWMAF